MSSSTRAFNSLHIAAAVLVFCKFSDFTALGHINNVCRIAAQEVFRRRVTLMLASTLLPRGAIYAEKLKNVQAFMDMTLSTSSGVVGSMPLALMTFAAVEDFGYAWPENLNLLVPRRNLSAWITFLDKVLGFKLYVDCHCQLYLFQKLMQPDRALGSHVRNMFGMQRRTCSSGTKYVLTSTINFYLTILQARLVTITTTNSTSILPTLLASRVTSQMNVLLHNLVVSFYPRLTDDRIALLAWPSVGQLHNWPLLYAPLCGMPVRHWLTPLAHTRTLHRKCGLECPRIWRAVKGFKGAGLYRYGNGSLEANIGQESELLWRIGDGCTNPMCDYGPTTVANRT
jgi:hypothetical protein